MTGHFPDARAGAPNSSGTPRMSSFIDPRVRDPLAIRVAGADLLGLALLDARNATLAWLAAFDGIDPRSWPEGLESPAWLAGHAGWFQEYWIARHVQRQRGAAADARSPRLPSIEAQADTWFDPRASRRARRPQPAVDAVRDYLGATLEVTLDLLDKAGDADEALHFFRLALHREDRVAERMAELAQASDVDVARWPDEAGSLPVRVRREPIGLPAQRVCLASPGGAWRPAIEDGDYTEPVPEFEIDAQPVTWGQWLEFVDDGGYDHRPWWGEDGWTWLDTRARRAPRYVEQQAGGVSARRGGRLRKLPSVHAALHLSWFEARAWCRWAGRRLPAEAEWVAARAAAAGRGFVWGDVLEWVADRAAAWPGRRSAPGEDDDEAVPGQRVLRGASFASAARARHPAARRFADARADIAFCGFRSCAL